MRVFRALDWPSSAFGSKVMAKTQTFDENLKKEYDWLILGKSLFNHMTRQPMELKNCSNPLKMWKVL